MGSYIISVSLGTGCYRHIRIASSATLYRLHKAILDAYRFDDDHQHAFYMDNRLWSGMAYFSSKTEPGEKTTRQIRLDRLALKPGDRFKYLFDFGDEWVFQCKMLRQIEENTAAPVIVRSVGEAPEQYPDCDDEWEQDVIASRLPEKLEDQEIRARLDRLPLSEETAAELHAYFEAAARLYGIIPVTKLHEIYNRQNEPVSDEVFFAYADALRHEDNDFFILSRDELEGGKDPGPVKWEVISGYLLVDDVQPYFELVSRQGSKPYKLLPKAELLCYADDGSLPLGKQGEDMLRYLCKKQRTLQMSPLKMCYLMKIMLSKEKSMQSILDSMTGQGLSFDSDEDIQEFIMLYQELNNHTRKQAIRGYSPSELFVTEEKRPRVFRFNETPVRMPMGAQAHEAPSAPPAPKVGRNDPCPCGSGLKYKKCCGKAQSHLN